MSTIPVARDPARGTAGPKPPARGPARPRRHKQTPARPAISGLDLYRAEALRAPHPSLEAQRRLFRRARHGDIKAVDELALGHLGLVVELVERHAHADGEILELIERGNKALVEAILAFASSGETDFDAFARFCIRGAIGEALVA